MKLYDKTKPLYLKTDASVIWLHYKLEMEWHTQ